MYSRAMVVWTSIAVVGAGFIGAPELMLQHAPPTLCLAHSFVRQFIQGNLVGQHTGPDLTVNFRLAEPGDIILCHNAHGAYGYWTHAVLYVGQDHAVDADDFARGTIVQDVSHYRNYDEVVVLRPKLPVALRQQAAESALAKVGTPYDPLGSLRDIHSDYCSKLIWEAYAQAGVSLCNANAWVLPDQLATSPLMECVADWGILQGGSADDMAHKQSTL